MRSTGRVRASALRLSELESSSVRPSRVLTIHEVSRAIALALKPAFADRRNMTRFLAGQSGAINRISQDVDMVTVRVNYRFGGPVVGRYR
jgi:hypothetical protein